MPRFIFLPLLLLLLPGAVQVSAQSSDTLRVNIRAQGIPLDSVFAQLERQYHLWFYYAPRSLPEQAIDARITDTPLPDALRRLLQNTGLDFFFYRHYAVAIAPENLIRTGYSPEYYTALRAAGQQQDTVAGTPSEGAVIRIGGIDRISPSGKARIKGLVTDAQTGEPVIRALVFWSGVKGKNTATDDQGRFESILPVGEHPLRVQQVGFSPFETVVHLLADGDIAVRLNTESTNLAEVLIKAEAPDANVSSARVGVNQLDPKTIKRLPTLLGEADVVRSLLLSTGVTSVGEGAAGINVRGGEADQNLMLQDEAVLYNATHALGFFSTYNTDLVDKVELYKSILPAQYGGRLASVVDVQMRDGSFEKWKIKGGVGPVSGRLSVEGPLQQNKSSIIAGVRASYTDGVLKLAKRIELKRSSASFYDASLRYTHRLDAKNTLILSGYLAEDQFSYNREFGFDYRTVSGQVTYKHSFFENFYSRLSLVASDYSSVQTDFQGADGGRIRNGISYYKIRELLTRHLSKSLKLDAGIESVLYKVRTGEQEPVGPLSVITAKSLETEQGLESALFGNGEWTLSPRLTLIGGLRLNHYRFLGPKTVYGYSPAVAPGNVSDTLRYGAGKTIAHYTSLEPRISGRYRLNAYSSLKAGYSRTSQFINQIFNTDTPTPTSQYQLSTGYIKPFLSHNFSAGYFRNTRDNAWETSAELFYRVIDRLWDYRDFANLALNEKLETEIRNGTGRAYGFECSVKTSRKPVNGQLGYTFSRTERQIEGINKGNWYPSNFDKPHIVNLVVNYQPSQRHNLTFNFTYSTGRPTTAPLTSYRLQNNLIVPVYSPRNQLRIPDYHRLDVSYTIGMGYNKRKTLKTSWNFSVYNVYARRNAFSVFFIQDPYQKTVANRLSILGTVFPAITLNIETI